MAHENSVANTYTHAAAHEYISFAASQIHVGSGFIDDINDRNSEGESGSQIEKQRRFSLGNRNNASLSSSTDLIGKLLLPE